MKKRRFLTAVTFTIYTVLAMPLTASAGPVVHVTGQNDITVDRQAIQAAIDSATGKKAKVELHGTFQLDGQTVVIDQSDFTLQGAPEGATVLGILDEFGRPDCSVPNFNRGIEVRGPNLIENIVIKGLTIISHCRGLSLIGTSTQTLSNDEVRNVVVKDNQMQNNLRGLQSFGAVADIVFKDNLITDAHEIGILVQGDEIGALSGATIKNNVSATSGVIHDAFPFQIGGPNSDVLIRENTFQGGIAAVGLFDVATNVVVSENWILDGGTQGFNGFRLGGVLVGFEDTPTSGYLIENNVYAGNIGSINLFQLPNERRDVWLWHTSSYNEVTEFPGTVVLDQGNNNTVTFIP